MSARTGHTTYVPGKGATTVKEKVKPSGKVKIEKTFQGKGPAPSGAVKHVEATAETAPTVTVSPTGKVSTSGFRKERAAKAAERAQKRSERRVKRIVRTVKRQRAEAPPKLPKAPTVKPVELPKPPSYKPPKFQGKPTAGTPTLGELRTAKQAGTVKVNKAGYVTTPKVRKVSKQLKQAKRVVAKTSGPPKIAGLRNKEQAEFAGYLSKFTKIPPKLAGEWVLQESGASSAGAGGEAGEQNQLGVGYPAHPTSFSESPYFNRTTPKKAAKATAKWMEGKIGGEYDYQAAPSIEGIPQLAKEGASEEEIRAYIEGPSAWGTGHIAQSGVSVTAPGGSNPKAVKRLKAVKAKARQLGLKPPKPEGPIAAKKQKGQWAGTEDILLKATKGFEISSEKRTPEHNAEIGGSPTSDHLTTATNAFATDLPTTDGVPIAEKVTKRLGIKGWTPGNYDWYTTPKYPGYRFQVLWEVEGHYDHVHVGAEWTGEDLPAGTVLGGSVESSGSSGGTSYFVPSGGGAPVPVASSPTEAGVGKAKTAKGKKAKEINETLLQRLQKLKSLGVDVRVPGQAESTEATSPLKASLSALERKYGKPAV